MTQFERALKYCMTNSLSWRKAFSMINERNTSTPSGDSILEGLGCVLSVLQKFFGIYEEKRWKIYADDEIVDNLKKITKWILPIIS